MLHCSTCRQKLTAYQEGTLDPASRAQVEAHLRECPDCARELRREAAIRDALHSIGTQPAPAELRSRVRSAIEAEKARKPLFSWAALWGPLGLRGSNLTWAGGVTAAAFALLLIVRMNPELMETHVPIPAAENAPAPLAAAPQAADHAPEAADRSTRQPLDSRTMNGAHKAPAAPAAKTNPARQPARPETPPRVADRSLEAPSPRLSPRAEAPSQPTRNRSVPAARPAAPAPFAGPLLARGDAHKPVVAPPRTLATASPSTNASKAHRSVAKAAPEAPLPPETNTNAPPPALATPEAPAMAAITAPDSIFTVSATWDGPAAAPDAMSARVTIKARTNPGRGGADGGNDLAPMTNVAPLPASNGNNAAFMAREGGNRIAASAAAGPPTTENAPPIDASRQAASFMAPGRRLNLVITPLQDVESGRIRVQIPANAAMHSSAVETVIWEGDARKNEPIRVPWSPPASVTDASPFTVILEAVGADERARTLQTQLVVVPPQSGATTK